MLKLDILADYDYFMKIDADVRILRPINIGNLLQRGVMIVRSAKLFKDNPALDRSALKTAKSYCHNESHNPHTIYYNSFVIGWLDLFTSPESLAFSEYHWQNGWEYRWGDQTFLHYALLVARATRYVLDASFRRKYNFFVHGSAAIVQS